jgi:DNA recombination protein RmuC
MQSLIVGAVATIVGVLLGYLMGKAAGQAESRLFRERLVGLEDEKTKQFAELKRLQESVTELTGKLGTAEANVEAEKSKYLQRESDLKDVFGNLAAEALRENNQSFLTLAKQELGEKSAAAEQTLAAKELAIKNLVTPLDTALSKLDEHARNMEIKREGAYADVKGLLENMKSTIPNSLEALKNETAQLIAALRAPKTRGNWGELQLKRCVEYAGMVQHCSFSKEVSTRDDDDKVLRPDMVIRLPNGREIVVDAKTPLDAFLDTNADPSTQNARFAAHALRVKSHLKELSLKAYARQFEKAPDFVVCFLPSEALFSAALEADPSLIEFGVQNNVVLATPTTLIALLRAVEYGWQQSEITQNAKMIHELGRKIYDKLVTTQGHVTRLGNALNSSVDHYNKFLGTIEGKSGVFFYGRQLGELVHSDEEIAEIEKLQPHVRELESEEWSQPILAIAAGASEISESRE